MTNLACTAELVIFFHLGALRQAISEIRDTFDAKDTVRCHCRDADDGFGVRVKTPEPPVLRAAPLAQAGGRCAADDNSSPAHRRREAGRGIHPRIAFGGGAGAVARTDLRRRQRAAHQGGGPELFRLAVRGGWPTIPADAKFAVGAPGPNDDLLRRRLLISGDLAADKATPARSTRLSPRAVKRFQVRHGLAPTGTVTPRTLAALNVPVQKRIKQLQATLERLENMNFRVRAALCGREPSGDLCRSRRERPGGAALSRDRRQDRKAVADADAEITGVDPQSDLDRSALDHENRNLGAYAQRSRLSRPHAHGGARCARRRDRSAIGRLVRRPHAEFHGAPAVRHASMRSVRCRSTCRIRTRSTCTTPTSETCSATITASTSHGCSRVDNVRDLAAWLLQEEMPKWNRAAIDAAIATGQHRTCPAEEGAGGLDLPHGVDDKGPDRAVPQRHLRPGRAATGSHRRGSGVLQSGRQSPTDGASGAVGGRPFHHAAASIERHNGARLPLA